MLKYEALAELFRLLVPCLRCFKSLKSTNFCVSYNFPNEEVFEQKLNTKTVISNYYQDSPFVCVLLMNHFWEQCQCTMNIASVLVSFISL